MTKLYTLGDAALVLNLSIVTIRRLIKKREIPYHRIGHKYFFTEEDLETCLSQTAVPIGGVNNEHTN